MNYILLMIIVMNVYFRLAIQTVFHRKLFHIFPSETFSRFPSFIALEKFIEKAALHPAQIHINGEHIVSNCSWQRAIPRFCRMAVNRNPDADYVQSSRSHRELSHTAERDHCTRMGNRRVLVYCAKRWSAYNTNEFWK